jgi:hypothetical protein
MSFWKMVELWLARALAEVMLFVAAVAALILLGLFVRWKDRRKAD